MTRRAIALVACAAIATILAVNHTLAAGLPALPLAVNIDGAAIERAIAIGRSSPRAARQRFHDAYVIRLNDTLLDRLEIVSEFRRVVLATEDRIRAGDVGWGPRQAADMLQPWRGKISLVLHVTFPPNNVYRTMPRFDILLYAPPRARIAGRMEPLDLLETPKYVSGQPAPPGTPILGGIVEATFAASAVDPLGVSLAGIEFEGRELRRVEIDFGRVR